jgi:ubiquinone/menaquinone biosynthesis C-methylase UbiE
MNNFTTVTEISGDSITEEQVERMVHRYQWASSFSAKKDVLEVGCGTGQGLGLFLSRAKSVEAGDYSEELLSIPIRYYADRVQLKTFDAQKIPFDDRSKDVIVLFEAIYYIPDAEKFVTECKRVLRDGGVVLIATANKELEDFNPSPHSFQYYNCAQLCDLFGTHNFQTQFYGYMQISRSDWKSRLIGLIKKTVVSAGLMPKTMSGKKILKRLVFGKLVPMPYEITGDEFPFSDPIEIATDYSNESNFKVIYCVATK